MDFARGHGCGFYQRAGEAESPAQGNAAAPFGTAASLAWYFSRASALEIIAGIGIGAVGLAHDRRQRIVADIGLAGLAQLGGMLFGGRVCGAISASCEAALRGAERRVAAGGRDPQAVHARAGARRDQAADDDVLLEADQRVVLALRPPPR